MSIKVAYVGKYEDGHVMKYEPCHKIKDNCKVEIVVPAGTVISVKWDNPPIYRFEVEIELRNYLETQSSR